MSLYSDVDAIRIFCYDVVPEDVNSKKHIFRIICYDLGLSLSILFVWIKYKKRGRIKTVRVRIY